MDAPARPEGETAVFRFVHAVPSNVQVSLKYELPSKPLNNTIFSLTGS
jgi:hypothetical protein